MVFSYYPGCTLTTKAKDLDINARRAAEALGITMEEIPEWQCCGGVYPMGKNETAPKLSSVRALVSARDKGQDLLTLCSACHHVLKRVNNDMKNDADIRSHANNYMQLEKPYEGEVKVVHYLEMLRDYVGFDNLKAAVKNPLTGKKIGAYYGCLLLRPSKTLEFDNPENPSIIEDFIRAIGAEPVIYPYRNECCGGYMTLENKDLAKKKVENIVSSAAENGCDCLVTACPLCMYNLTCNNEVNELPVIYFTELLCEALGLNEKEGE